MPLQSNISYQHLLALLLFGLLCGCSQSEDSRKLLVFNGPTMGTSYTVKIHQPDLVVDEIVVQQQIDKILKDINKQMSTYLPDSSLSKINDSKTTDWQEISTDLSELIDKALQVSILSNGAYDITIGPLVNLWGFGPGQQYEVIPTDAAIEQALSYSGFHHLQLRSSPPAIKKEHADIYLDLSGIAKGYAVDKLALYLESLAIQNYMVEIGGEIRAKGKNDKNETWRIGIERPTSKQRIVQTAIDLRNISMATSGDYRNYFEKDGKRYSHTIDPLSGKPITHKLASVTVLHDSSAMADALATAFLVLGDTRGYELASRENIAALFIYKEKGGFREKFTLAFRPYLSQKP